jgi:2-C-methyl-D-erythritol 4-phosphate cytidylyltransferase
VRIAALLLAAGSSQRFGGRPKQFEDLGGITVLQRAVRVFAGKPGIDEVWVVTSQGNLERTREVLVDESVTGVIVGGEARADSTREGLNALGPEITHVLVHDAARPLVPDEVVRDCVDALEDVDMVATVVEPRDSVLVVGDGGVATLDRDTVRLHQTPQGFRRSLLADALARLDRSDPPTDDVSAVLRVFPDQQVRLVAGHPRSLKITDADDLLALRAFLGEADL